MRLSLFGATLQPFYQFILLIWCMFNASIREKLNLLDLLMHAITYTARSIARNPGLFWATDVSICFLKMLPTANRGS